MSTSRFIVSGAVVAAAVIGGGIGLAGYSPFDLSAGRTADIEPVGFRGELEGTVSTVDADARVLHIARGVFGLSSSAVVVTDETRVHVGGKIGAFGDLREGVSLRICYEVGPAGRRARAIEVPPSHLACGGAVEAVSSDPPREEPAQSVPQPASASSDPPAPALAVPAKAPSALPAPVAPERPPVPAAAPARVAAPPASPAKPRPRPVVSAPSRPAAATEDTARPRPDPPAQSGEDYGAVIDWVLRK